MTSCLKEDKVIITDFDYVKLTETKTPLSPFYCKGTIRGMRFSYSTNDNLYADTYFPKASSSSANANFLYFSIGNFTNPLLPIWFYIDSGSISLTDFLQNRLKTNAEFPIIPEFHISLYVKYTNQYSFAGRYFNCCTTQDKSVLKITNVEYFDDYTAVTFQYTGKLYSSPGAGDSLYFGDASVEMRIRIDK